MAELGTAINCEKEGHCWHEGTTVGSLYCCKCGKYDSLLVPVPTMTYVSNPYLEKLTAQGLQDIACGRINKIPNIRQVRVK